MLWLIVYFGLLFASAICRALQDIQVEGEKPIATGLPCWRKENKWILRLTDGYPVTGYHFYGIILQFLLMGLVFVFIKGWDWRIGLLLIAFFLIFWVLADFFWFVFNPHYGLKKFNKKDCWWHKKWLLGAPRFYWTFFLVSAPLFYFGLPVLTS